MLKVDSKRRHCLTSCEASTSSIAREQNTRELRLSVEFIVLRKNASLMHNTRALMEGHLSASRTTLLAVDLGRWRIHLPIFAWKDSSFLSKDGFNVQDSTPYNRTGRTQHSMILLDDGLRAPAKVWMMVQSTVEHPTASGKECSSCFSDVLLNPFVAGE